MAKTYVTYIGFIQFKPTEREANGKNVTDIVIKTAGGDGQNLRITVWPEFKLTKPLELGDLVAVDGEFTSSTYQNAEGESKTSFQLSPYKLNVNGEKIERVEREVVSGGSSDGGSGQTKNVPF